jgi:hypothetical protein
MKMNNNLKNQPILTEPNVLNYEDTYKLRELKFLMVIVGRYQGDYYIDAFNEAGVSATFVTYGQGTVRSDIQHIIGIADTKKDVVMCLVTKTKLKACLDICEERFKVSKEAKGVAFAIPVDSMISVLSYKFITDTKQNRRK